jgi:hypothetical protein
MFLDITKQKEVGWRGQVRRVNAERAAVHLHGKKFNIFEQYEPCIVTMNNEFSPIVLWLELSQ